MPSELADKMSAPHSQAGSQRQPRDVVS